MKPRTLIIGDIHGGLLALQQVLERASVTPDDQLIFLGDYVDGWSQSAEVISYLIALDSSHTCLFIRGNHDTWFEAWLRGEGADKAWLFHGGQSTVESYSGLSNEERRPHLEFFSRLRDYYVDAENRLFIHAGFTSMHGPDKEHHASTYSWDRTLWEMAVTMDRRIQKDSRLYPKRLALFNEIYIGHTPTLYYDTYVPMQGCNVWNADTGAAFYGKLSVLDIDTKEYWQSDTVQKFYPAEKGRNK